MQTYEEKIKNFESAIDSTMQKNNIFKNNFSYLIQCILGVVEERINSIKSENINSRFTGSIVNETLEILNCCIKFAYMYCKDSTRKDPECYKKVKKYFTQVKIYFFVQSYFVLYKNNKMSMNFKNKTVVFKYNDNMDNELEALNFFNSIRHKEDYIRKFNNEFEKIRLSSNEDKNALTETYKRVQMLIQKFLYEENLIEQKNVCHVFSAIYTYVLILCANNRYTKDADILYIDCDKFENRIVELTGLPSQEVKETLSLFTYQKDQKLDIMCTPLLKINDNKNVPSYITSKSLILYNNFVRNIPIRLGIQNSEEHMIHVIKTELNKYKNILCKFQLSIKNKNDNSQTITDIDMSIFDKDSNSLIVAELKNLRWADSINEHINIQGRENSEGLNKAYKQIELVQDYYEHNKSDFMSRSFGKGNCTEPSLSCVIVLSYHNLGYKTEKTYKILDLINLFSLVEKHNGNLEKVIYDINNEQLMPQKGVNYSFEEQRVNIAGYEIIYPVYKFYQYHI